VTVALILVSVPARRRATRTRVDVVGAAFCVSGLGSLAFGLIEQHRYGWASPLIWGTLAAGAVLLPAFVWWERRASSPMLPLRLFRRRNFSVTNVETFAVYAGLSTLTFFLALFLQELAGYSALRAGLSLLPVTIVMFLFSRSVGRLAARQGPRLFMGLGPTIGGVSLLFLVRLRPGFSYWTELLPPLLGFSVGLTLTVAPLTATVLADAGARDAGIASGVNNAVARVAGLLGIALVGLAVTGSRNTLDLRGFQLAMLVTGALVVVGGAVGAIGIVNPRR
jgi:predicted MFS family arabinose efflux permease